MASRAARGARRRSWAYTSTSPITETRQLGSTARRRARRGSTSRAQRHTQARYLANERVRAASERMRARFGREADTLPALGAADPASSVFSDIQANAPPDATSLEPDLAARRAAAASTSARAAAERIRLSYGSGARRASGGALPRLGSDGGGGGGGGGGAGGGAGAGASARAARPSTTIAPRAAAASPVQGLDAKRVHLTQRRGTVTMVASDSNSGEAQGQTEAARLQALQAQHKRHLRDPPRARAPRPVTTPRGRRQSLPTLEAAAGASSPAPAGKAKAKKKGRRGSAQQAQAQAHQLPPKLSAFCNPQPEPSPARGAAQRWRLAAEDERRQHAGAVTPRAGSQAGGTFGAFYLRGLKPAQQWQRQDRYCVHVSPDGLFELYVVLDGHGKRGHDVAQRCSEWLPRYVTECGSARLTRRPGPVLAEACRRMHEHLMADSSLEPMHSGTTMVLALRMGDRLVLANLGDSRAVLFARGGAPATAAGPGLKAMQLTLDHKPDRLDERRRIEAAGGLVQQFMRGGSVPVGPFRVWCPRRGVPGLAMSRSLGDGIAHSVGVSAEPEISDHFIGDDDLVLVLATDGVWDFLDLPTVSGIVGGVLASDDWAPKAVARALCVEAQDRWMQHGFCDDITALAVRI